MRSRISAAVGRLVCKSVKQIGSVVMRNQQPVPAQQHDRYICSPNLVLHGTRLRQVDEEVDGFSVVAPIGAKHLPVLASIDEV